jgi:hypothetical protein
LILKLYEHSDPLISPRTFCQRLDIYNGEPHDLLNHLIQSNGTFIQNKTFRNINNYIKNYIPLDNKSNIFKIFKKFKEISFKVFYHKGCVYNFQYIKNRLININNSNLKESLFSFFKDIYIGNFPTDIFDDLNSFRASNLMFKGTRKHPLNMKDLLTHLDFSSFAKKQDKHNLRSQTEKFISQYMNLYGIYPNHSNVLSFLFLNNSDIISLETLSWKRTTLNNFMTGHLDSILVADNSLKVCDLKRSESEIIRYLPQLIIYTKLLKNCLNSYGDISDINFSCIGLSSDIVYEFDPFLALKKVIGCISQLNKRRNEPLSTKDNKYLLLETIMSV